MAEILCERCAHPNSSASNFCSSCGYDLSQHSGIITETLSLDLTTSDVDVVVEDGSKPDGAAFVVKRGSKAGSRYALDLDLTTVGRHPESAIFLDDVTVSRRHAEVRTEAGAYIVSDVGSLNGTYLNRERIDQGKLTNGDELQIGKFKLVFLTDDTP